MFFSIVCAQFKNLDFHFSFLISFFIYLFFFAGNNSDFSMDLPQKEQVHDSMSMIQAQHLPVSPSFL